MFQWVWRLFGRDVHKSSWNDLNVDLVSPRSPGAAILRTPSSEEQAVISSVYEGLSGFGIPKHEEEKIRDCKSAPTYGEMIPSSVSKMIQELKPGLNDIFYDLGSGVGKVAMQVVLEAPVQKSIGIELADSRFKQSKTALGRLKALNPEAAGRLEYRHSDFSEADISDATMLFMCSTCYPNELLTSLCDQFIKVGSGLKVVSLKALPDHPKIKFVKAIQLKMTWSESSAVNFYEVI